MAGLETGMDGIARSNHPIETMLADSLTRLSPPDQAADSVAIFPIVARGPKAR